MLDSGAIKQLKVDQLKTELIKRGEKIVASDKKADLIARLISLVENVNEKLVKSQSIETETQILSTESQRLENILDLYEESIFVGTVLEDHVDHIVVHQSTPEGLDQPLPHSELEISSNVVESGISQVEGVESTLPTTTILVTTEKLTNDSTTTLPHQSEGDISLDKELKLKKQLLEMKLKKNSSTQQSSSNQIKSVSVRIDNILRPFVLKRFHE